MDMSRADHLRWRDLLAARDGQIRGGKLAALAACAAAAWTLSQFPWRAGTRTLVPFGFLLILFAIGAFWGRGVGIAGSLVAAVIFAHELFLPVDSLSISNADARSSLAWMLLAGVSLSFLLLPGGPSPHRK